eukprot:CFRG2444T1
MSKSNARSNLEVFKFAIYVFIPIGMFWYFNLPSFYDKYVADTKRRVLHEDEVTARPPNSLEGIKALRQEYMEKAKIKRAMEANNVASDASKSDDS